MKSGLEKLLKGSNPEELSACIQMLALSVVQHRANCGFVTLQKSKEQLDSPPVDSDGLFVESTQVVEEAIVLTRMLAAEQAAAAALDEPLSHQKSAENRWQLRITVSAPIKVLWAGDAEPVNAQLENISWGGAAFHVGKLRTAGGDTVEVILPSTKGGSISIQARILRTWELPDGQGYGVASRFPASVPKTSRSWKIFWNCSPHQRTLKATANTLDWHSDWTFNSTVTTSCKPPWMTYQRVAWASPCQTPCKSGNQYRPVSAPWTRATP